MTPNDSTAYEPLPQSTGDCRTWRVLLVDEHRLFREAVRVIVEATNAFEVVGEAVNATQALERIATLQPDLVITDLALPDGQGVKCIKAFVAAQPQAAVLVLTAVEDEERASTAMKLGARAYILKNAGRVELLTALREVAAGRRYLCKSLSTPLRRVRMARGSAQDTPQDLTERQLELLRSVASGCRNKDIALRLGVSVKAVQHQRERLSNLLNLRGAAALTLYAARTGLLSEP
jgi:two-component system NarL family response regulator